MVTKSDAESTITEQATPLFQPIVTGDARLTFEVLGRLKHNDVLILPSKFIPQLNSREMVAFDRAILSQSIRQVARWQQLDDLEVEVHVNASADVLVQSSYVQFIEDLLRQHRVLPKHLTIEVVETCDFWTSPEILETMLSLKYLGVKVAIDDFPCWSDLESLIDWLENNSGRIDSIKLDQSLVYQACADVAGTGKLRELLCYIEMAHRLGISVVAEGVYSEQSVLTMQLCGADALQGYWLGKPQTASETFR